MRREFSVTCIRVVHRLSSIFASCQCHELVKFSEKNVFFLKCIHENSDSHIFHGKFVCSFPYILLLSTVTPAIDHILMYSLLFTIAFFVLLTTTKCIHISSAGDSSSNHRQINVYTLIYTHAATSVPRHALPRQQASNHDQHLMYTLIYTPTTVFMKNTPIHGSPVMVMINILCIP